MSHSRLSILALSMLMALPLCAQNANLYMHRSTDANAADIDFTAFEAVMPADSSAFSKEIFKNPGKEAVSTPVIAVSAGGSVVLPVSLLDRAQLNNARGHVVRFHLWMKGEETGQNEDLWNSAPRVRLIVRDGFDSTIEDVVSSFKTRGSFPWFCYYVDVEIPAQINLGGAEKGELASLQADEFAAIDMPTASAEEAAEFSGSGVFMILENPTSGVASFAGFSWEILKQQEAVPVAECGSRAPNPDYDELPMHLFYGIDADKPETWKFLSGNQVSPNVLTLAGLKAYLQAAQNDWFSLIYGAANLLELKKCSQFAGASLVFEDGWDDALRAFFQQRQDPETGLWLIDDKPDMMVSQAIAEKIFADSQLPQASRIVRTLLDNRAGNAKKGRFWNQYVLAANDFCGDDVSSVCQLGTTTAAVLLLRQAISHVDDVLAAEAWAAIDEAVAYVIANHVREDGTWIQATNEGMATSPAFMLRLLNASRLLDARVNDALPLPEINADYSAAGNKLVLGVASLPKGIRSLRVYSVAADDGINNYAKAKLIAIIQPASVGVAKMDPIRALQKIGEGARKRWGADVTWSRQGANELNARLVKLNVQNLALAKKVTVKIPALPVADSLAASRVIIVVGVNERGEVTSPVFNSEDASQNLENDAAVEELPQQE